MNINFNIPYLISLAFGTKTPSVDSILSDFSAKAAQLAEAQDILQAQADDKRREASTLVRSADALDTEAARAQAVRAKLNDLLGL